MKKLSIEQQNFINEFKHNYPDAKLSDAEILSIYNEQLSGINLTEDQKDSILAREITSNNTGLELEKQPLVLPQKSKEDLIDALKSRIDKVKDETKKAENNNGMLGSAWSFLKNTVVLDWCTDSTNDIEKARKEELEILEKGDIKTAFEKITGTEFNQDNIVKFMNGEITTKSERALNGYKEGQDMAVDVIGDMVSGIAAVGIYSVAVAAAPFSAGVSIAAGAALATVSGGLIKAGVKALDTVGTDKEYSSENFKHDLVTGGFSGALAPVTAGLGGAVGKTLATKLGVQAIKTTGGNAAAAGVKGALMNPAGYEYIGGNIVKRGLAMGAEMATDGTLGGAIDGGFRAGLDNDWDGGAIISGAVEGGIGGFAMSPIIGGGMKSVGKTINKIKGIDEFSSLVTNCKNLSDEDLSNLYIYYKNYEQECIKNNKQIPDMKRAGFDKLMEEINSRKIDTKNLIEGAVQDELTEVAPFAERLEQTPDIKDLTNPEVKEVRLENGEFNDKGEFVPDGTCTVTGSGNPLAKSRTFKRYPDGGEVELASNFEELCAQIAKCKNKKTLAKFYQNRLKDILDKNPDISVQDISEIISDLSHITDGNWSNDLSRFFETYSGLFQIKDLKTFKANISEYDKFLSEIKKNDSELYSRLRNVRFDYLKDDIAAIKPEDFKKNLEFYKSLDSKLQNALSGYDATLFKPHNDKYFERVRTADNYNRWASERDAKLFLDYEVKSWGELSDETYEQVLKNIELVKEMINADVQHAGDLMRDILGRKDSLFTDICAKIKSQLGDDFDYSYFAKLKSLGGDITPAVAIIHAFGEQAKTLSGWDFQTICSQYYRLDEAGKRNFLAKIDIAAKMTQFSIFNGKLEKTLLEDFMKRDIANAEKIAEFVKIAEPKFLEKIGFKGYSNNPIFAFEELFAPQNLDNMIACAKLHKDLPEDFLKYLQTDNSIIGHYKFSSYPADNFQYMISPEELASRIETIKKYNGKLAPNILEQIYNGRLTTTKTSTLDMLCAINDKNFVANIVSYNKLSDFEVLDEDSMKKFIQYVNNCEIDKDDAMNFCFYSNPQVFKELSAEELDVISFKDMARNSNAIVRDVETFRQMFNIVSKPVRDLLKPEAGAAFYCNFYSLHDSDFLKRLEIVNNFSEEDLDNIGAKVILEYLNCYRKYDFNPKNIERWKSVPQDIKDKLGRFGCNLLANDKILDTELLKSKVDNLKNNNVFASINGRELALYLENKSKDMDECLNIIFKDSDFNRENINKIIDSFQEIIRSNVNDWDFVRELINNPKLKNDDISGIINCLHRDDDIRGMQKSFAQYLIEHEKVDNTIIPEFLRILDAGSRWEKLNKAKMQFAKELIENPEIDKKEIPAVVKAMSENIFEIEKPIVTDLLKSRRYHNYDVYNWINLLGDKNADSAIVKCSILKDLIDRNTKRYSIQAIMSMCAGDNYDINVLKGLNQLIKVLPEEITSENINLIISQISGYAPRAKAQISLAVKLIELKKPQEEIPLLLYALVNCNNIDPEVMGSKIYNMYKSGVGVSLITDICNNAKSISVFNEDVITILGRLKQGGCDIHKIVEVISDNEIPTNLMDKINSLNALSSLTDAEKLVFKRRGVDIDAKMKTLMAAIDTKYPLISTSRQGVLDFLKHIKNSQNTDNVIKDADFTSFGKKGIELEYSREEFIRKMDEIIHNAGVDAKHISTEGVEIPELKLSENDVALTKAKIAELASSHKTEEVEVIIEGQKFKGTRFLGTQGGSNKAYYTQIGDKLYYIKYPTPEKLGQSVEEVIASRLYRAAGIDAPNMKYVYDEKGNIIGMAGEYVPDLSATPKASNQFTDGFATDAWLSNWDAPKNDNTQYRTSGVVKVDVGGSLRYRARGEMKDFGSVVNELSTLIEQNGIFMTMTKQQLLSSLKHVTEMSEARIQKIIDDSPLGDNQLTNILLKRKEYMTIFQKKLEVLDEDQFDNILDMVSEAKRMTAEEFTDDTNVAEYLGYVRTRTGFEGLLNTTGLDNVALTAEQRALGNKLIEEIKKFTVGNRVSDNVKLDSETKEFLNSILQGIPEFAPIFSKPQHSTQAYALDIHILKVLQDSMKDSLYNQLDDTDKIVLKFSTLLHDIGKRYLIDGSDTGHAAKCAEYVYSILDRFNFTPEVKDRIISVVANHHWFKAYCQGTSKDIEIATLCRNPQDFLIYQIIAKADLKNVSDEFYLDVTGAKNFAEADKNFAAKMAQIQPVVDELASKQVVVTPSRFVEVPERVTSTGRVLPARGFNKEVAKIRGEERELRTLNLTKLSEDTDMFEYGFNHIPLKKLRLLVHMVDDSIHLEVFKTLAKNPMNNSAQSLSLISMADKSTYDSRKFGLAVDVNNSNVSYAYYSNIGSGNRKGFERFVDEMFTNSSYRTFVKDNFKTYLKEKGIEISDDEYAKIAKYIKSKKYPETQVKSLKVGERTFMREDILGAFTYSRDQLIDIKKMKTHGEHNELVALNPNVKGLVAKVNSLEECPAWFLEFAHDNDLPIILIGE